MAVKYPEQRHDQLAVTYSVAVDGRDSAFGVNYLLADPPGRMRRESTELRDEVIPALSGCLVEEGELPLLLPSRNSLDRE
ncbi:hypothetical protein [Streptomyces jeddahensis]|uniref:hypothetical protein n=1 Tax=Streptomyces jeddahensis TaxID=1716141 RepID=UPI000AFCA434|nr:hypothetical protein [Streptomyces jeddahensis]